MSAGPAILLCVALLSASAEQERLRLRYDDVAARAQALIETVDYIKAGLELQGYALHPRIASARDNLVATMERASVELKNHNWNQLRRDLVRARGWIEQLERRL